MPFVNPVTVIGETVPVATAEPHVASYPVNEDPRRFGAPKTRLICPDEASAEAIVGASGASCAMTVVLAAEVNAVHASLDVAASAEHPTDANCGPLVGMASITIV
jgi:hypothetical protein